MEKGQHDQAKLARAIKRLTIIRGFYSHLVTYLIINLVGLLLFIIFRPALENKLAYLDVHSLDWINWNIILIPVLWGIGLFGHWLYAFQKGPRFLRDWEERQIKKYMEK